MSWSGTGTPISSADIDAYVTLSEAATYLASDPRHAAIALNAANAETQTWYLLKASSIIDNLPLKGSTYNYIDKSSPDSDEQARMFPRVINGYACDWDDDTSTAIVPEDVKKACVEEAISLYDFYVTSAGDQKRRKLQNQGVTGFSIGKLSETYGGVSMSAKWRGMHSQEAYDLMKQYIAGAVRPMP